MNGDPKEVSDDLYTMKFADDAKPGHELILKKPKWDKDLWRHKASYEEKNANKQYLIDGNKAAYTRYTKIPKTDRTKEYRLKFPVD
jgi:hypothetical protein